MTKKRCIKLMMSYLCSSKKVAEQWYGLISAMIEPPVRNVEVLLAFHGVACGIYQEEGDREMALYAAKEIVRLRRKYGARLKMKEARRETET